MYHIISNEVTKILFVVKGEDWTSYFIFTDNILLFLPYYFPPFRFIFFPFSFKLMFFSDCRKNNHHCLQTQTHNFFANSYVQTHSYFCVYVFISVYVFTCICVYQLYTSIRVQVRRVSVCETRLARMNFLYFFSPSTDDNVVLQQLSALSSHILPCSMLCGYPWRTYSSGLQISFPVPQVPHLSTIINISSESPWPVQDSCKSDCITSCVFAMPTIPILTYCTQWCVLMPSS